MRESNFNTETKQALEHWGAWAYKMADLPASLTKALRFTPEKPCDIIASYRGRFMAIEGKQMKKYEAFGLNKFRPSQIREMDSMVLKNNEAFVFLNIRVTPGRDKKGEKKVAENKLLIFRWETWRVIWADGSTKADELRQMPGIPLVKIPTGAKTRKGKPEMKSIHDLRVFLNAKERSDDSEE